jgi:ribonucleoside-triphosphate reductase
LHAGIADAFAAVNRKQVLPSMRSLQFGGEAILSKHTRIYNCAFTHIDRLEAFRETFYLLLCGCGVGFSVQRHHVAKLPPLAPLAPDAPAELHEVVGYRGRVGGRPRRPPAGGGGGPDQVRFDYSSVRPAGAPLRTSGGKAPGPEPLFHARDRAPSA